MRRSPSCSTKGREGVAKNIKLPKIHCICIFHIHTPALSWGLPDMGSLQVLMQWKQLLYAGQAHLILTVQHRDLFSFTVFSRDRQRNQLTWEGASILSCLPAWDQKYRNKKERKEWLSGQFKFQGWIEGLGSRLHQET